MQIAKAIANEAGPTQWCVVNVSSLPAMLPGEQKRVVAATPLITD